MMRELKNQYPDLILPSFQPTGSQKAGEPLRAEQGRRGLRMIWETNRRYPAQAVSSLRPVGKL